MKRKIKIILALSISLCIVTSQIAMAASGMAISFSKSEGSVSNSATAEIIVRAQEVPDNEVKEEEIKTKISREEAQKIAKSFEFSKGYEITYINLENYGSNSPAIWRMELSTSKTAQYISNISIGISADTGELYSYYNWQNSNNKKNIATVNKKQAMEIASKFIADQVKIDAKDLILNSNYNTVYEKSNGIYEIPQYNFSYGVKVNGILAGDMLYNIQINAATGRVLSFNAPYYNTQIKYPSAEGVRDMAEIKGKYSELLEMKLMYIIANDDNKPKASLAYYPYIPGVLNAKTLEPYVEASLGYSNNTDNVKQINPGIKPDNKAITQSEAEEKIEKIKKELENFAGVKFEAQQPIPVFSSERNEVSITYNINTAETNHGLNIAVSLSTGNITGFSYYKYTRDYGLASGTQKQQEIKEKISYSDAKKISDNLIKKLFEKQYGLFSDVNGQPDNSEYLKTQQNHQFSYIRYENGISSNNFINIGINKETGKPDNIFLSWNDIDYPKPDKIISKEEAKEAYLKEAKFELAYYSPYNYSKDGTAAREPESIIIYRSDNVSSLKYVDAFTGEFIDYFGNKLQDKYSDESHWADNSIEMLGIQGILLSNVKDYDMKLTRQDAVKMLALTVGIQPYNYMYPEKDSFPDVKKESPYYSYVESAVSNNIIAVTGNKFDGEKLITKKEFTVLLLNAMGYKELLKHSGLFAASGRDIYYNICDTFDILPVKPGEVYKSADEITFAEAAYSLQKALKYFR